MSTITAILEPDADGTLHLPLPEELRGGKVKVAATLELANDPTDAENVKRRMEILETIRALNPFQEIKDPVAWQREMREDVVLPGGSRNASPG